MPRLSRRRRMLDALLDSGGRCRDVQSFTLLSIGWPGRGSGTYRDDDGTHARVSLADGTSVVFREYARTNKMAEAYQQKEALVFDVLRRGGLPTPSVLAAASGGVLLSDAGGEPLETLQHDDVWGEVGTRLRQLHDIPVADDLWLGDRPWMDPVPYLIRTLRRRVGALPKELLGLLRGAVTEHLAMQPRSICCGGYSLPGLMIDRAGRSWTTHSWLSLGYYVSIGDPDRDVVGINTHHELPDAFYDSYGRRPDPVATIVYDLLHRRAATVDDAATRLRAAL